MGEDGGGREGWKEEGERKAGGRWPHSASVFSSCLQRSLYSGLQSPAAAPGPALGSFAFLPTGSAGVPTLSDLPAR